MTKLLVQTDDGHEVETIEVPNDLDPAFANQQGETLKASVWNGIQKARERESSMQTA